MQKDHPETPKLKRIKKVANASTSELIRRNTVDNITNIRPGSSYHRASIAPTDFNLPHSFPKKRDVLDRRSILPKQALLDGTRIVNADFNDMELKLLYDQYLQKIMTEIILKQKAEEKEKLFLSQLATIVKEHDHNQEILYKLKNRERDIINLTKIQNEIDAQITDVNNCTKGEDNKTLENILSQLHSLLQPLDKLRCNNIILPETAEEWEETSKALKSCSETLKSITDLIGSKNESYQAVNNGIKEFVNTFSNIEDHQKRLEKELCSLQALVLKTASLSLMQSNN